jgi:aldose 1-epimerase
MDAARIGSAAVTAPSGEQFEIRLGDQRATVVEVGGGIREYAVGDRDVLEPYAVEAMCDAAHGAPLIPWPNRLADGRYTFDGVERQLPLTEPGKRNAIHGLLRWRNWRCAEREPARVVVATRLHPAPGYPFTLDVAIQYALADDGLTVTTTATNVGDATLPYGAGQHPYLSPGQGLIDDAEVELVAGRWLGTDDERQLPTGLRPVDGSPYDFRTGRRLGAQAVDFAFTDLGRDADGRAWVRLAGRDGHTAALWVDGHYPYLELFTGDSLAPDRRRRGLGCEPMTCPPNAFATGQDVVRLEPAAAHVARWGARIS